ncbi:MAG: hypothetical protein V1837_04230 [Candidatus Woesearchaeota archaeon]
MKKLVAFAFLLVLLACVVKAAGISVTYAYIELNVTNEPPSIVSLSVGDPVVYEDSEIVCNATALDRENNDINYHYSWSINNQPVAETGRVFHTGALKPGDSVSCIAVPFDMFANGTSAVASTTIQDMPVAVRAVKQGLSLVGVDAKAQAISGATQRGLLATTGFVAGQVSSSTAGSVGLLLAIVAFLVFLNLNLALRLKKKLSRG